ncbi:hypothetical protein [Yersinia phage fHe-Yen9-04]|uniref:Uncharacterized protein n=2 Tax=Eneladusvirus Yen904 TaxID=2560849 RepID=A0A2C9CXV3_9CAUD|nr:hypothetical protein FDJ41_gp519 [Yersinia phage fHe-Yen9-04]SOK58661.1 hypothetical protein [Yersinia phage fHe-Yen9-04]SOK59197.1 hypothetical protein [Yersinia phage fHe-Yen9-03]VUE36430.1 hypothetical protein [Yersinia phage fHe-Yen9-04]
MNFIREMKYNQNNSLYDFKTHVHNNNFVNFRVIVGGQDAFYVTYRFDTDTIDYISLRSYEGSKFINNVTSIIESKEIYETEKLTQPFLTYFSYENICEFCCWVSEAVIKSENENALSNNG